MDFLKDRGAALALALAGAGVALLAGLAIAWSLTVSHRGDAAQPPPASRAGLVIDPAEATPAHMDPTKPLRCFVAGQPVGELTLAECAKRNGVSTDALDVGVDNPGALASAQPPGSVPAPPPSASEEPAPFEVPPPPRPSTLPPPQVISGEAPH